MSELEVKMEKLVALAKRRGFIYPGSEIYGGLAGTYDFGPLGVALKRNIENLWWRKFVTDREDMFGVDAAIIMNPKAWEASGHVAGFSDPLVECAKCQRRFRADHVEGPACPECGGQLGAARQFNMMFKTHAGASEDAAAAVYLRPETAGGMFVNFKNVIDSFHPKLPFGLAQIGKAFRNEIAPRDFVFRSREFSQMEVEYFVRPSEWEAKFEEWRQAMHDFASALNLEVHELEVAPADRAHYSKRTIDFEFEYPFGRKELWGLAYRTDFDLSAHTTHSKVELSYYDEETKERLVPHVIEPSLGVERTVLATLSAAYREDELGGEPRSYLALPAQVAPYRVAVFPLLKNKPELVAKAREVYQALRRAGIAVIFDDNGNIGKRYRRQDEIGTPACVTIDFDTLGETAELKETVTLRDRDSGQQRRVAISDLVQILS